MKRLAAPLVAAAQRATVQSGACRLGVRIGMEWVRPKRVRRIDTGDLRSFSRTLERAGEVVRGLDAVEAQVRGKIGRWKAWRARQDSNLQPPA